LFFIGARSDWIVSIELHKGPTGPPDLLLFFSYFFGGSLAILQTPPPEKLIFQKIKIAPALAASAVSPEFSFDRKDNKISLNYNPKRGMRRTIGGAVGEKINFSARVERKRAEKDPKYYSPKKKSRPAGMAVPGGCRFAEKIKNIFFC
jgi:hypothetical protein